MLELFGLIATTIATIGGIAAYFDAVMGDDGQKRILSYVVPTKQDNETDENGSQNATYSEALQSILRVYVSGPMGRFDVFRSLVTLLIILVGTSIFSFYMVRHLSGDSLGCGPINRSQRQRLL
ncbi:hypothetical protein [Shimia abyssi]|uniref:Uncharacterized protein n=1 Tax=Shimia abyssi TaxID=1662395 RepID=A0A2P8FE90_9RHOB|nr:hypothetical protein [Shimia abyssi]PSL20035.1 hypothetical protein CLV88_10494 [Shimia abyssi]